LDFVNYYACLFVPQSRKKIAIQQANEDLIKTSNCLGAENLMKLLGNYCRNKDIKTIIRVGVVGM